jgi:hypothetical protein
MEDRLVRAVSGFVVLMYLLAEIVRVKSGLISKLYILRPIHTSPNHGIFWIIKELPVRTVSRFVVLARLLSPITEISRLKLGLIKLYMPRPVHTSPHHPMGVGDLRMIK